MNIHEVSDKIKRLKETVQMPNIYVLLLIILVGFGSFGLGRLSKLQDLKDTIRFMDPSEQASASALSNSPTLEKKGGSEASADGTDSSGEIAPGGQIVASKSGTKYHYPWCSGAQRITDGNKIWFSSIEEARKAGYTPASNCKGLK